MAGSCGGAHLGGIEGPAEKGAVCAARMDPAEAGLCKENPEAEACLEGWRQD